MRRCLLLTPTGPTMQPTLFSIEPQPRLAASRFIASVGHYHPLSAIHLATLDKYRMPEWSRKCFRLGARKEKLGVDSCAPSSPPPIFSRCWPQVSEKVNPPLLDS